MQYKMGAILVPLLLIMIGCGGKDYEITYTKDRKGGGREVYAVHEKGDVTSYRTYADYGPDNGMDVIYDHMGRNKWNGKKTFLLRERRANFSECFQEGDEFVTSEESIKNFQAEFERIRNRHKAQEKERQGKK